MEKSKHVNRPILANKPPPKGYYERVAYSSVFYTLPGPELENLFKKLERFGWKVDRVNNRLTHNAKGESLRKDYKLIAEERKKLLEAQMKRELLKKQENLRKSNLEFRVLGIFLICLVIMIVIIIITAL
jgi:hypothetical protein